MAKYTGVWTSLPYAEAKACLDAVKRAEEEADRKAVEEKATRKAVEEEAHYFAPMRRLLEDPEIRKLRQEFLEKSAKETGETMKEEIVLDAGGPSYVYGYPMKETHVSWVKVVAAYATRSGTWSSLTLYYVSGNGGEEKLLTWQELDELEKKLGIKK